MAWPEALISAAAVVVGVGVGALTSRNQTGKTLEGAKGLQSEKLGHETDLAREEREYKKLSEAYIPMLTYIAWVERVNLARADVVNRRRDALQPVLTETVLETSAESVVARQAAYDSSGPTVWEQRTIDASPTPGDTFRVLGLVDAFASEGVRDGFRRIVHSTEAIEKAQADYEAALMNFPGPLGTTPSIHEVAVAAKQQLKSSGKMVDASFGLLRAMDSYSTIVKDVVKTARAELEQIKPKADPSPPQPSKSP